MKNSQSDDTKKALDKEQSAALSLDDKFGGSCSDLVTALQEMKLSYNPVESGSTVSQDVELIGPQKTNLFEVCSAIDLSYQESISNLITSADSKVKYVRSIKL